MPLDRNGAGGAPGVGLMQSLPVVLVTEDDQQVQFVVEEALSEGGFETVIAATGEEAITLLQDNHTQYRALVTDIQLGGEIDGWEVARTARELSPTLPVVYVTAGATADHASKGVPDSVIISKPFAPAQIVTAVSQLLNAVPASTPTE